MRKAWSLFLAASLLLMLFPVTAFGAAASKALALTEDWQLTSDLDLKVGAGDTLVIDGANRNYIYEMGGVLLNSGEGTVYLKNSAVYAQGDNPAAGSLAALSKAARILTAITAPAQNATALALPAPEGFTATILSSSNTGVITAAGVIAPPASSTEVTLVLALADAHGNKADTGPIAVTVPAKSQQSSNPIGGNTPSGSGSTPSATLPAGQGAVQVSYTLADGAATLALPASKVSEIIGKSTAAAVFDLSGVSGASAAAFPKDALTAIAKAGLGAEIRLPGGVLTVSSTAAQSIVSGLTGTDVSFRVAAAPQTGLNSAQQGSLQTGEKVLDISVVSASQSIHTFNGAITVTVPYSGALPAGVWYLNDAGVREKLPSSYDAKKGNVSFEAPHLSLFVLGKDSTAEAWINPFTDVKSADWFYADVEFAVKKGLFGGTSETAFSPDMAMTRGMLVTVLGRVYGADVKASAAGSFQDVAPGQYYAPYVEWARTNGIVDGVADGMFLPDASVSRQDLAVILVRYAQYAGKPLASPQALALFGDEASIAPYAKDAIQKLYHSGLLGGSGNSQIEPQNSATRAQVAAILHRFLEE